MSASASLRASALVLALFVCGLSQAEAQQVDTAAIRTVIRAENELDSIRAEIRKMEGELQSLKASFAEGTDLTKLLAALTEEELDDVPEDQRSKRKRVDALLKAIRAQPGQLRFNGGATTVIHWNPGRGGFATGTGSFDIFAHTSLGDNSLVFVDLEAIGGNGPDARVANIGGLNADAGSTQDADGIDRLRVLEAWAEFMFFDEGLTISVGKIDVTNYFDNNAVANDETSQFLSGAFVNSSALIAPPSTPGIRFRTSLFDRFFIQFSAVSADNSGDNLFSDLFRIGSVGFRLFAETKTEANLRLYGYQHPLAGGSEGYGVSYDQSLSGGFGLFGRFGRNSPRLSAWSGVRHALSGGARYSVTVDAKRHVVAAAFGQTEADAISPRTERVVELYARIQVNKWAFFSPHLQWVQPAGTTANFTLLSVRTQFNF